MALLFVELCQAEARRANQDLWVGFAWNDFLAQGKVLIGNDSALTSECWVRSGLRTLFETNRLSLRITPGSPSVLFPTSRLLTLG
jgi:hypothetical protein